MESRDQAIGQAVPQVEQGMLRRAIVGASVGNLVEWFDFAVYAYLAATLGAIFFPSEDPTVSLLSSFAVFGVVLWATGSAARAPWRPSLSSCRWPPSRSASCRATTR